MMNFAMLAVSLLYWNIQNGMWDGQGDNYDRFVAWVKAQDPDICVWCEAASLYYTGTYTYMKNEERYLPAHWKELAKRYGHDYVALGAYRDGYPQVVTSKHPIETVRKIAGTPPERYVIHGAGWFKVAFPGRTVNVVTLHPWPQKYSAGCPYAKRAESAAAGGGDRYRRIEMEEILRDTVGGTRAALDDWVMCGDFNAISRADNAMYRLPEDSTKFLLHDLIAEKTDYVDLLAKFNAEPKDRISTFGTHRIDFVYASPSLAAEATGARVVRDAYTTPRRSEAVKEFWMPSDHLPVAATFDLKPLPTVDPCLKYASEELAAYAMKLTGRPLPRGFAELRIDPSLGEEAFRLQVRGGKLVVSGGDPRGVLYGVYEYLERHCGVRWYARWREVVPQLGELPLPKGLDDVQRPAFAMRTALWYDAVNDPDFATRLRLNGELVTLGARHGGMKWRFGGGLGSAHTMNTLVDPLVWFKPHPEYFALWNGKRDWDEFCYTNPELLKLVTSNVLARIRKDPGARYYGVSQNDTETHCQCDRCRAVYAEEGAPSGTVIRFVNAIAAEVEKEFPEAIIETLAYRYSAKPPKKTRPRRNVMPCFCTFKCEFSKPLDKSPYRHNREMVGDLAAWRGIVGDNLYVWDYTTDFRNYLNPFPNVRTMQANCRLFKANGVKCLFEQGGCQGRHAEFAELKAWLLSKWLWNPDAPADALIDDFMRGYYGAAASYVRDYFDKVQALAPGIDSVKTPLRINVEAWSEWITEAFLDEGEALWEKALAAVKGDPQAWWNVRRSKLTLDVTRCRRGVLTDANREATCRRIRELRELMAIVAAEDMGPVRLSNGSGANDKRIQADFDRYLAGEVVEKFEKKQQQDP